MRGERVSSLTIEQAKLEDASVVKVVAKNTAGQDTAAASLKVQGKGVFDTDILIKVIMYKMA